MSDRLDVDARLKLLSGSSFYINGIKIQPYKISEIIDIGYVTYRELLNWISLSKDDFINAVNDPEKKFILENQYDSLRTLDFYLGLSEGDTTERLILALKLFLRTDDIILLDNGELAVNYIENKIIKTSDEGIYIDELVYGMLRDDEKMTVNRDNFDEIVQLIKNQNYIIKEEIQEDEFNPADEKTRKIQERIKEMRDRVEDIKRSEDRHVDNIQGDFSDLISIVSTLGNVNKNDVFNYTIYQVYNELERIMLYHDYDSDLRLLIAGGDIDFENTKHWSSGTSL